MAAKFKSAATSEDPPDVILCAYPTVDLCLAAEAYASGKNIPVVLDIRDLWPETYLDLIPRHFHAYARLFLGASYRRLRRACSGATAITGITPDFVDWAISYSGRSKTRNDVSFPLAYDRGAVQEGQLEVGRTFWKNQDIGGDGNFVVCFFGAFGRQFEISTVIEAAAQLEAEGRKFQFVLCGRGDKLEKYRRIAESVPSVIFPGWVGAAEIRALMEISDVGLAPYRSTPNFIKNLPNKIVEYLSAGLAIVSSLRGNVEELLSRCGCGSTYENRDTADLAHRLRALQDNPGAVEEMGKKASRLYTEQFQADQVYGNLLAYLKDVVKDAKRDDTNLQLYAAE